jgi:phospholipase/carboxylesterase
MINRLAQSSEVSDSSPWQDLIPVLPDSSINAVLAKKLVRPAVDAPIATFLPKHYEAGYAYPLIVWLHDSGENERHLPQVMRHISLQNFVAVAPRATNVSTVDKRGFDWRQKSDAIADADEAVDNAIRLARSRFNIHPTRVFLIGHGAGGTMATRLALHRPRSFAGAASIAGSLPRNQRPLRQLTELRGFPFFIASSRDCQQYSQQEVCDDLRLLHAAGCSVALRQYPGDDDLTTMMLGDVNRWIMDRVCGT